MVTDEKYITVVTEQIEGKPDSELFITTVEAMRHILLDLATLRMNELGVDKQIVAEWAEDAKQ